MELRSSCALQALCPLSHPPNSWILHILSELLKEFKAKSAGSYHVANEEVGVERGMGLAQGHSATGADQAGKPSGAQEANHIAVGDSRKGGLRTGNWAEQRNIKGRVASHISPFTQLCSVSTHPILHLHLLSYFPFLFSLGERTPS